jgi:AraC-like DNA-binding protein
MKYSTYKPGEQLKNYVKCYYTYESEETAPFTDTVFPSGCIEVIFNLGEGAWQVAADNVFLNNPAVELWGQIVDPLRVRSIGKHRMLGIRFFPHAATFFLNENIDLFNNQVVDFRDVTDASTKSLHQRLLNTTSWSKCLQLVEDFLMKRLGKSKNHPTRVVMLNSIMNDLNADNFFDNISNVASRYGISSRYLQKLFVNYTGLTPKLFTKINRFQESLRLINIGDISLTSIAYECGYFDQSHFIREFKAFTGYTPSEYASHQSPITSAFSQN